MRLFITRPALISHQGPPCWSRLSDTSVPRAFGRCRSSDWWSYSCCDDPLRKTQSDPKNKSWLSRTFIVCFSAAAAGIWSPPTARPAIQRATPPTLVTLEPGTCGGAWRLLTFGSMWRWREGTRKCSVSKQQIGTKQRANQQTKVNIKRRQSSQIWMFAELKWRNLKS